MNTIGYHLRKYLLPSIQGRGRGVGLLFCLFIISCSQESVPTYDTSESRLNIWVGTAAGIVYESVSYNYSYAYEEGTVPFYAQITGVPADHDRTFRLEPFGPAAAQVAPTVRVEDFVIKAGAIGGTFQLHLNTQLLPDPSLFTEKEDTVRFRMVPNDEFLLGTEKHQEFTIVVKNFLSKPDNWDRVPTRNDMLIFKPLKDFFGDYRFRCWASSISRFKPAWPRCQLTSKRRTRSPQPTLISWCRRCSRRSPNTTPRTTHRSRMSTDMRWYSK